MRSRRDEQNSRTDRFTRWVPAASGLITSITVLLLLLTGHADLITPVALFGAAVAGGSAVQIRIRIRH